MIAFKPNPYAVAFFLCPVTINGGLLIWAWSSSYGIVQENGPIENLQVVILGLTLAAYAYVFSQQEYTAQTLAAVFCSLCVFLILKELDFKELKIIAPGVSHLIENSLPERTIKLFQWLNLLFLMVFLIHKIRDIPSMVRSMTSLSAWPFYLCFGLLLLSQAIEHEGFHAPEGLTAVEFNKAFVDFHYSQSISKLWEELIELNAYMVLFYAAQSTAAISCLITGYEKSGQPSPIGQRAG